MNIRVLICRQQTAHILFILGSNIQKYIMCELLYGQLKFNESTDGHYRPTFCLPCSVLFI